MKAGIFDTPAGEYYADAIGDAPTLNPTVAKILIRDSPLHAFTAHPKLNKDYRPSVDRKFDVGSAAHELFLLGNDEKVKPINAADWRTKAAQNDRDEARAHGQIPLLEHEWQRVKAMLDALREQVPHLDADPAMFVDGKPEQTLVWEDQGVWCRARLDWLHDDHSAVDDLKTTKASASPYAWTRTTLWNIGADIQATMTIRGLKAVTGRDVPFRFLAVESTPPYAMCPVALAPAALELANRKIDRALALWRDCLETDFWNGYPQQICYAEPLAWHEAQLLEREVLDEEAQAA